MRLYPGSRSNLSQSWSVDKLASTGDMGSDAPALSYNTLMGQLGRTQSLPRIWAFNELTQYKKGYVATFQDTRD